MKASEHQILSSINQIKMRLEEAKLLYIWNNSVVERTGNKGRKRITWAVLGTRPDIIGESNSNINEYLTFLKEKHFQFQLIDGSLIQLSYEIDSRSNVKCSRLVWYPCPIEFIPEELEYATLEELVRTSPTGKIGCRAPIRIDFSPELAQPNHPHTHLHLGMEDFRLPVHRAIEPLRFIRLIVRTIYPKIWETSEIFRAAENWAPQDFLEDEDKSVGFLSWHIPIPIVTI